MTKHILAFSIEFWDRALSFPHNFTFTKLRSSVYLKTGIGYDCPGHSMANVSWDDTSITMNLSWILIFGRTLPTGSGNEEISNRTNWWSNEIMVLGGYWISAVVGVGCSLSMMTFKLGLNLRNENISQFSIFGKNVECGPFFTWASISISRRI